MKLDSFEMRMVQRAVGFYMRGIVTDLSMVEVRNDPDQGDSAGVLLLADEQRACEELIEKLGDGFVEGEEQ